MSQSITPSSRSLQSVSSAVQRNSVRIYRWLCQRLWLLLPLLAIPALWPLLRHGLPESADGTLHLLRLVVFDHHIGNGVLYPRWTPELFKGLGYPVFNFYGPLAYYLAELLHLIGLDFVSALIAAFAVLMVASGFGMYRLARDVLGAEQDWPALVAATAYMYAPYLLTNVYIRGAVAEVGAQAWLPWVFWSSRRLLTSERPSQYVLAAALTLGGLAVTHNITLLFTPVVLVAYVLVVWWQTGRSRSRLGWMAVALAAAMGVSAFFWLPLIGERQLLSAGAYEISSTFLPENVWSWHNFIDMTFAFKHTFEPPFQLGLVQLLLALAGLLVARRRDVEWLYFIALAVLAGLGISAWSQPLWLSSRTLLIAQFPWRLLAFMTVSLSLFTGAILAPVRREMYRVAAALVLLGLIILANRPQVDWMPVLAKAGDNVSLPAVAQFEYETGAIGTGSAQEFRPRWSVGDGYEPSSADIAPDSQISLSQANDYDIKATVSSPAGGPLRFTSLYYPAWRATLEDGSVLPTYPSTNLGLVTVDLPAGVHELTLRWAGTGLQRLATWLSLLTLAALVVLAWVVNRPRWMVALPLGLLILGLAAVLTGPAAPAVQVPAQPVANRNLAMLGYRLKKGGPNDLYIYPYWYIQHTPPANTLIRWQLRDATGQTVSQAAAHPYFNSQAASDWPPGTLVDDAYRLALPPGLAAGSYQLDVQVADEDEATAWTPVGTVTVATSIPVQPQPAHPLAARFGDLVDLEGFDVSHDGHAVAASSPRPLVVRPGDSLDYTLYWQPLQPLLTNYHGFIHLVDRQGQPLAKRDQVAGSFFRTPMMWDSVSLQPDRYLLRIPARAANGLYWPIVGLYEHESVDLLPVHSIDGQPSGDTFRLPPVKVMDPNASARPQHQVSARLGDLATLLGYDLALPQDGLRAGSPFSVTLYYQVDTATDQDLTQFVQLFNPDLGMAAQQDALPQDGANPTWAWLPGETVVDVRTLQVRDDAAPGDYRLMVGLYDATDGVRLSVADAEGTALPDGLLVLTTLTVAE